MAEIARCAADIMKPKGDRTAFRLEIEYDGGRFQAGARAGQTSTGVRTVADTLERAA